MTHRIAAAALTALAVLAVTPAAHAGTTWSSVTPAAVQAADDAQAGITMAAGFRPGPTAGSSLRRAWCFISPTC